MAGSATQVWLDKAAEDEAVVKLIVQAGGPWSMAAYHLQQAAENLVKAALAEAGVPPPRTHDLEQLLVLHPQNPDQSVFGAAQMLSGFAWLTRYPGAPPVTQSDVVNGQAHLAIVTSWVSSVIP